MTSTTTLPHARTHEEFDHMCDQLFPHAKPEPSQLPLLAPVRDDNVVGVEEVAEPDVPHCVLDSCDRAGTTDFEGACCYHATTLGYRRHDGNDSPFTLGAPLTATAVRGGYYLPNRSCHRGGVAYRPHLRPYPQGGNTVTAAIAPAPQGELPAEARRRVRALCSR
jgi:hypothetical protein